MDQLSGLVIQMIAGKISGAGEGCLMALSICLPPSLHPLYHWSAMKWQSKVYKEALNSGGVKKEETEEHARGVVCPCCLTAISGLHCRQAVP